MRDARKVRRVRSLPASNLSDELHEDPLRIRLRRIAEEQSMKAIEELERLERERKAPTEGKK